MARNNIAFRTEHDDQGDVYREISGKRLAAARTRAGLTHLQLAKAIGITNGNVISRYETDGVLPALERKFAIAAVLGASVDEIWGFAGFGPDDDTEERPVTGGRGHESCPPFDPCLPASCRLCRQPCECTCHRTW